MKNAAWRSTIQRGIAPHVDTMRKPKDVHFTDEGSALLAKCVASSIEAELAKAAKEREK